MNTENNIGHYSMPPYAVDIAIDHSITTFSQALPQDVERQTEAIQRLLRVKPKSALTILEYFLAKYPEDPAVACFASSCYEGMGKTQKSIDVLHRLFERHPHSMLLRAVLARWFIQQGLREHVHQILGEKLYISEIFPERTTFYAIEVTNWAFALGMYFIRENKVDEVQQCIDFINEIAPTSPYVVRLMDMLKHTSEGTTPEQQSMHHAHSHSPAHQHQHQHGNSCRHTQHNHDQHQHSQPAAAHMAETSSQENDQVTMQSVDSFEEELVMQQTNMPESQETPTA